MLSETIALVYHSPIDSILKFLMHIIISTYILYINGIKLSYVRYNSKTMSQVLET